MATTDPTRIEPGLSEMAGANVLFPLLGGLFSLSWALVLMIGTTVGVPRQSAYASWAVFLMFALFFGLRKFRLAMPFLLLSGFVAAYPFSPFGA